MPVLGIEPSTGCLNLQILKIFKHMYARNQYLNENKIAEECEA